VVIVLTAGALHDAALRLFEDTGSIYFLGIQLICPLMRNTAPRKALNTEDAEDTEEEQKRGKASWE
jgi:hypothetical protein